MTPRQLKAARLKLRLSARQLAEALGMPGQWADRTVRAWEGGEYAIPEHVADAVAGLLVDRDRHLAVEYAWRQSVDMKPIKAELRKMTTRDRDAAERVAKGGSFAAVGRHHGITRERVRQIWHTIPEDTRATLVRYMNRGNWR